MTVQATQQIVDQIFPKQLLLCQIFAIKEGELSNGALCLTADKISFVKGNHIFRSQIFHFPRQQTQLFVKTRIFTNATIQLQYNGAVISFIADNHEAMRFYTANELYPTQAINIAQPFNMK